MHDSQVTQANQWEDWEGNHDVMSALQSAGLEGGDLILAAPRCGMCR